MQHTLTFSELNKPKTYRTNRATDIKFTSFIANEKYPHDQPHIANPLPNL